MLSESKRGDSTLTLGNQFPGVKDTEATIRERHDFIGSRKDDMA